MVCYGKLRFFQNVQKISKVPLYKYQYRKKDQENAIWMKNDNHRSNWRVQNLQLKQHDSVTCSDSATLQFTLWA